ncbi:Aldo/keto reductase [Punctularia strigosozonata HHB-11173 SS5]|uniref:Aldo/keto reductase n=1 Tax=Punctularia strigosozonata (strain HHB-11173) TaxID=741275 RepID=UPI0004416D58|nr:Aldo/keto reductase [Punctularia strigosozonata HHB-11173 SS5]EIN12819.1 Aldo/keto reductase [Punctularia strigosozonata HHB-11173 SS5]
MPFGTVTLNDGNEFPTIAFGSGTLLKGKDASDYVTRALDAGFWHIDTAQYYQNEASVGQAIRESGLARHELYITTKYGFGSIEDAFQGSLQKLGLTFVDLYLIHTPNAIRGQFESTWKQFEKYKEDGLTRSIGVSNFTLEDLRELLKTAHVKPAVNQIRFHPYNYAENKSLLEYSAKHGIVVEAYSSLTPLTQYPGGPVDKPIQAAAERLGATPAQVIFLWVRSKGVTIVTQSSKSERLQEYLAAADLRKNSLLPALTDDEIDAIDKAGAQGPPSGNAWRGGAITVAKVSGLLLAIGIVTKYWGLW